MDKSIFLKYDDYVVLLDRMVVKILFVADMDKECRVLKHDGTKDTVPFSAIRTHETKEDIEIFESRFKLYPSYNAKQESNKMSNKFLNEKRDYATIGARLDLNLVQCQALNKLHTRVADKYESIVQKHEALRKERIAVQELDTELLTLLTDVNKFLGLFKDFPHPDSAKGLWNNSDEEPKVRGEQSESSEEHGSRNIQVKFVEPDIYSEDKHN